MKGKKLIALLTALVMMAALLTACGGSSETADNAQMEMAEEKPAMDSNSGLYSTSDSAASGGAVYADQKLIKTVNISAETEDLETLLGQLSEQVATLGGYIESQDIYNGSSYSSYRYRSARLKVRIPADRLESFVGEVKGISNVVSYNEAVDDVTLTYVDTESRIAALETEQERLLELLGKAENMSDLLKIEERLTEVQYELAAVQSQLRVLKNKVSYATVNLDIDQVEVYTEVEEPTVWERVAGGFTRNLKNLGDGLTDFFVWIATYSPQLIFWAVVITVAVVSTRRIVRKRRDGKNPPYYPPEQPEEKK